MTAHALLFTLSAIGISETVYLIKKRKIGEKPFCVLGESCHVVLESRYNRLLYIHNDVLGLVFYIAILLVTALLVIGTGQKQTLDFLARFLIFGGVVVSGVLLYIQWKIIKKWCFWCIGSAITIFLMSVIVLVSDLVI